MYKLIALLIVLAFVALPASGFAEDDEEESEETPSQVIDFDDELNVDGERKEADLYRHDRPRKAKFKRLNNIKKRHFLGGGGGEQSDADEPDEEEGEEEE